MLRSAIRYAFPDGAWIDATGAPPESFLLGRQENERAARQGAGGSADLLDFADTGHLAAIVEGNWDRFSPVFGDEARTRTYLDILRSVRNTVAHSRALVPFERDLLSGAAQHLGNLLAIYRTAADGPEAHYPSIESLTDNFGRPAGRLPHLDQSPVRLQVGDRVRWEGRAVDPRGRGLLWYVTIGPYSTVPGRRIAQGTRLAFEWVVGPEHVGEGRSFMLFIRSRGAYFRYREASFEGGFVDASDDYAGFRYNVSPPREA